MNKKNDKLKRVIVDFKKLTPEILALLVQKYPDGYDDDQIISFRNQHNEIIEAVEVTTEDTKYLVKVSTKLAITMENYEVEDFDFDPDAIQDPELTEDDDEDDESINKVEDIAEDDDEDDDEDE